MSKIAIVGCDASGKTVLISSLSDYYKAGRCAGQTCIMVPADGITRRYTDNLHRVMRINGEWPEATSDIAAGTLLKWKMMRNGKEITELELLDFGGENFRYAFRNDGTEKNPEVVAKLKDYIAGADFIVITVSMDKMLRNLTPSIYRELENGDIEYDRDSEAQWVTDGLLRMVADKVSANPPGVVVALTQADKHRAELQEYGGAKAIFAKCWPTIAMMYPDLNVVPCASIDKMSENGLPADGYSTEGVLAVMKEYSRHAFGDCDGLCKRMDAMQAMLSGLDEKENSKIFVTTLADYRKALEALGNVTAIIGELFSDRIAQYENFLKNIHGREETAMKEQELHAPKIPESASAAESVDNSDEVSADRQSKTVRSGGHFVRVVGLLLILVAVIVVGIKRPQLFAIGRVRSAENSPKAAEQAVRESEKVSEAERAKAEALAKERESQARQEAERAKAEAERAKEAAARAQEAAARAREKAEQERRRLENERIKAEQERAREEAARKDRERKMREAEEARKQAEAEMLKAKENAHEAELALKRMGEKAAEAMAKTNAVPEDKKVSRDELLRMRAEERELKYQEVRERQRLEREQMETAGLMTSLVDAVNKAHLERGRNLIADLSGERKLTKGQVDTLNYAKAYMDHLEKAQNGNADDMLWIGNQYYTVKDSFGIVKNPREAFGWYRQAAFAGSAQAYYFMSLMTEQGEGCKKDDAQAGRFCLKAARLGNAEAMFWTGIYFDAGTHGFEKSSATAYKFLSMARAAGFENPDLDKMIRRVQRDSDGETIDSWFPENPLQEPVKPEPKAKDEGSWWTLGVF